jgi:hypothetical protein
MKDTKESIEKNLQLCRCYFDEKWKQLNTLYEQSINSMHRKITMTIDFKNKVDRKVNGYLISLPREASKYTVNNSHILCQ